MPRAWVLERIDTIATAVLNLDDYWEYGCYLELLSHVGAHEQLRAMIQSGLAHADPDVRDMAEIWKDRDDRDAR